ncbi:DUF6515 family protein [Pseudaeromonas paramecii]|uniref:Uncharacterized protein n=1 Tax=Pseudaeromonas paramecii TaxID=2138166 RepID=A0ABP8QDZ4_9GAMM
MKSIRISVLACCLVLACQVQARPGGGGWDNPSGPGAGPGPWIKPVPQPHPAPGGWVDVLPRGYQTVLVAGLTYFVLNDIWYKMNGGRYQVVTAPTQTTTTTTTTTVNGGYEQPYGLTQVDIGGVRYYVRDGRYYRRNVDGEYLEVTPPASQRGSY